MWSTGWADDGEHGPDDEALRRMGPPENELPVALPQDVLLARTADVAVALLRLQVHSTGLAFDLTVRVRPGARPATDLHQLLWRHGPGAPGVLVGVELADGRRADNVGGPGRDDVVFTQGGGSGGEHAVDQSWWLSPLPPAGPLTVVVRATELGLPEIRTVLDGAAIRAAADGVVELWPWEPPRPVDHHAPPPLDVPDDSWFARD